MKLFFKILLSVFILFILVSGSGMFFLSRGLDAGEAVVVNASDFSALKDGSYTGEYKGGRWSNKVSVTIKDHKLTRVEVIDDVLLPKKEVTAELVSRVLEKQTTEVDAVAGATVTSKAYLKSIENALGN